MFHVIVITEEDLENMSVEFENIHDAREFAEDMQNQGVDVTPCNFMITS